MYFLVTHPTIFVVVEDDACDTAVVHIDTFELQLYSSTKFSTLHTKLSVFVNGEPVANRSATLAGFEVQLDA